MSDAFVIPGAHHEPTPVIEVMPAPVAEVESVQSVDITPDMYAGVEDYAVHYESPYSAKQRAIAISALKHSFFLPAGRHRRPRS
jgi:hypothetical protein